MICCVHLKRICTIAHRTRTTHLGLAVKWPCQLAMGQRMATYYPNQVDRWVGERGEGGISWLRSAPPMAPRVSPTPRLSVPWWGVERYLRLTRVHREAAALRVASLRPCDCHYHRFAWGAAPPRPPRPVSSRAVPPRLETILVALGSRFKAQRCPIAGWLGHLTSSPECVVYEQL